MDTIVTKATSIDPSTPYTRQRDALYMVVADLMSQRRRLEAAADYAAVLAERGDEEAAIQVIVNELNLRHGPG